MKAEYKATSATIGKYRTVAIDSNDRMIPGRKGWIFSASNDGKRIGMVLCQRRSNAEGFWWEEKITYHDIKELGSCTRRIGVIGLPQAKAIAYANNPNLRHDDLENERNVKNGSS